MKWNKYTLKTRTEAEDLISSMMQDAGIEGIEIEDKVPLSQREKEQMFVDILPEGPADDGVAYISFYLEPDADQEEMLERVREGLKEIAGWGVEIGEATIQASETEDKDWINNWKEFFHQFYVDEADDIFLVIFSIFHRRIQDAQLHALLRENVQGGVEDTIRLPVVIQQIHAL